MDLLKKIIPSLKVILLFGSLSFITSCSDSNDDVTDIVVPEPPAPPEPETVSFSGGGVKGPMALAEVNVYQIDPTAEDFKGDIVGTGSTNAQAQIENLTLTPPLSPPYLLEITAIEGTIDITTGLSPVITQVSTLLTQQMIDDQIAIYATPLTDMTVSLIFKNADSDEAPYTGNNDGDTTLEEIMAAMPAAQSQVKSTLGFGLDDDVDIFTTPPLIDDSTDSADAQASTTAYRSAVEALTAIVFEMQQLSGDGDTTTDAIIDDMAADLSDGMIDGEVDGEETASYPEEALDVLAQDPATLPIPNDPEGRTVSDVKDVVVGETEQTGQDDTDTTEFENSGEEIVVKPAETSPDIDGDGVLNSDDAFPESAAADTDTDNDGTPDVSYFVVDGVRTEDIDEANSDPDDDNDGVADENDDFPLDDTEFLDSDQDGVGNNADDDDDGDGVVDTDDDFPLDSTRSNAIDQDNDGWPEGQDSDDNDSAVPEGDFVDTDGDGLADSGGLAPDADDDNDGVSDADDAFPLDATESNDQDNDGIGDNTDTDIDGDNVPNDDDLFPRNPQESIDTDLDGIGNNSDLDDDGDDLTDEQEALIGTDPLDSDTDNDGAFDGSDAFPLDPLERFDSDNDSVGNESDNCPLVINTSQIDTDEDGFGDLCDNDDDNDGVPDTEDDFPLDDTRSEASDADGDGWPTEQDPDDNDASNPGTEFIDTDGDGIGNTLDDDDDGDGFADEQDEFPLDINEWLDSDQDGTGNNADTDDDNDQYSDSDEVDAGSDPLNGEDLPDDFDGDFIPDVNDDDIDGDGIANGDDAFDFNPEESVDSDEDGVGDNSDAFPNDPTETNDFDQDMIGDNADNCPMVANPEQTDIDENGVGDVCDQYSFDLNGTWLATEVISFDQNDPKCSVHQSETWFLDIEMNGEMLFIKDADDDDEDDGVEGTVDLAGNIVLSALDDEDDFEAQDASYNTDTGLLTIEYTQTFDKDTATECAVTGTITATQFTDTNEEAAFTDGIAWFEADMEYDATGVSELFFEYGVITNSGPESIFSYDKETETWVTADDEETSDYALTPDGIIADPDIFEVQSFGENGETAIISTGIIDESIDLLATPLAGVMQLGLLEEEFYGVIPKEAVFSEGAVAYLPVVEGLNDVFELWCDDSFISQINEALVCSNGVVLSWNTDNVELAQSIDDIVNSPGTPADQMHGAIWLGSENGYDVQAYFVSDNGQADGTNLKANIYKSTYDGTAPELYDSVDVTIDMVGDVAAYSFLIPDSLQNFLDIHSEDSMPMVFEDSELEASTIVRRGHKQTAGERDDTGIVFNSIAFNDILAAFNYVDTDGDGIPDPIDDDKDNDGVSNDDDAFPLDDSESNDTDGDGVGDNTDTDIDGDGVVNDDDLDPFDDTVTQAISFTADDLLSSYVQILDGALTEPTLRLGVNDGQRYEFDQGFMSKSDSFGSSFADFNFTAETATLNLYFSNMDSSSFMTVDQMVDIGMIDQQSADNFKAMYGDYQIEVIITTGLTKWQRLESVAPVHRFWQVQEQQYLISPEWEREQLTGSVAVNPFVTESDGALVELTDYSTINTIAWTAEELTSSWTLPVNIDLFAENQWDRKQFDIVDFGENNAATSQIFDIELTWAIDSDGLLVLDLGDNLQVTIQKIETFETGVGALIQATDGQSTISSYELLLTQGSSIDIEPLLNRYLQNSFSLTNPDAYDEEGMLANDAFFGYRLETGGSRATRILDGGFNFYNHRDGWDRWFWSEQENGDIELNALWHSYDGVYASCFWGTDEECNRWRIRMWRPLQLVGNRLYVLEWEERNNNSFTVPSADEDLYVAIAPRINFYEVYDIDSDKDRVLDSIDNDDDNDGVNDANDEFPFDPNESMDSDGDLIGNNADNDDDNDGVDDKNDAFPLDDSETSDTDMDGIGDNSDDDIDGDGTLNESDLAPFNEDVGAALAFTSDNLLTKYVFISDGALDEPDIVLGFSNGDTYSFANNVAMKQSAFASLTGGYALSNDTLTVDFDTSETLTQYYQVDDLVDMGIIDQQTADNFLEQNGDYFIETNVETQGVTWQLINTDGDQYVFWQIASQTVQIVDDYYRELLFGALDAPAQPFVSEGQIVTLVDYDSLSFTAWTSGELVNNWAMPVKLDFGLEELSQTINADIVTFADNGTGTSSIFGLSFNWQIDNDGLLIITLDTGEVISIAKEAVYDTGIGAYITYEVNGLTYTNYALLVEQEQIGDLNNYTDLFLQNSFSLTDPNAYDDEGMLVDDRVFGWRLENNDSRVTRITNGDFDLSQMYGGWDRWFWEFQENNLVVMTSLRSDSGSFADCDADNDDYCNYWRVRYWQPLATIGDRIYVLEWEEINDAAYNFPSETPVWSINIPPRIQFYQVMDIDSDGDGIVDSLDPDDDNDGVNDENDAYPFDVHMN